MSLCAFCGQPTGDPGSVCRYHSARHGDDWARGNRLMCDLLHRGTTSPKPHEVDRLEPPETYGEWMRGDQPPLRIRRAKQQDMWIFPDDHRRTRDKKRKRP